MVVTQDGGFGPAVRGSLFRPSADFQAVAALGNLVAGYAQHGEYRAGIVGNDAKRLAVAIFLGFHVHRQFQVAYPVQGVGHFLFVGIGQALHGAVFFHDFLQLVHQSVG